VGYLLREPERGIWYNDSEDEFKCLNLDVIASQECLSSPSKYRLPVLFWVHGGSQIISFGNGSSKIGDVWKIARDSVAGDSPIIVVSVQYRLNIFHVGDGTTNKNLGLKDLQCALEWVHEHIAGFGGDPDQITLAGDGAGAVLSHALIVAGAEVKRAILMSGSLHMSPPQAENRAQVALVAPILERLQRRGYNSLKTAPVRELLEAQQDVPIKSVFLQAEAGLVGWSTKTGKVQELMVGDCQYESSLYRNGIYELPLRQLFEMFDRAGASAATLKKLYHIVDGRPWSARLGALEFLNDMSWAMQTWKLADRWRREGKTVFTYLFDQENPWQASAGAHHAVDLIYLFGGFDLSHNPAAQKLATNMRRRFISFVNGDQPWPEDLTCAFGPVGQIAELCEEEVACRRRMTAFAVLNSLPPADLKSAFGALIAGRLSFHN